MSVRPNLRALRASSVLRASIVLRASLALVASLALLTSDARAHEGHDHGPAPAPMRDAAQRLADGSVFVPKPMQRQLALRTIAAQISTSARTVELAGRVIADPNAGGRVQPTLAGRIQAGPRGLPVVGQAVQRGEVLATVLPTTSALDRSGREADLAQLAAQIDLAQRRLARLEQLEGSVPMKEVEAARGELAALRGRRDALRPALATPEALVAPVSGVVAVANALAGQVVEPRDVLFEIVDPQRLLVEALAYDATLARDVAAGSVVAGDGASAALAFVGAAQSLREQALPLMFRTKPPVPPLAVGQPVRVVIETRTKLKAVIVPNAAIARGAANEPLVWTHDSAERFTPRRVTVQPLDGARSAVLEGLQEGSRVVVQGAALLGQVR